MRDYGKISVGNPHKTFFTADPHFFHASIIGLCGRPFSSINEMNETLVRHWNAVVPRDGVVFVLGDMFWKGNGIEPCVKLMDRLNGVKYLVAGNHDTFPREEYLKMGFANAWDYLEAHINKQLVVCCHYPFLEWAGFYRGSWHLHGHSHGRGSHFSARVMDVGVDANNYMPVFWSKIQRELADGMELDEMMMKEKGNTHKHRPYEFD